MRKYYENCAETMKHISFDVPIQVRFRLKGEEVEMGGIAYQNYVICGCCGAVNSFDEFDFIELLDWIDISNEIKGDD